MSDPILTLLERQLQQASLERRAQTAAFERALGGLRWELRVIATLALILFAAVTLAQDGVLTRVGLPGVVVETHAATPTDVQAGP
ncbi:MAG TPA: hypothetical protein VEA41_22455 [Salinarimonas sp.]|nr:hypothetical protein [Salinarimonas sp.]